MSRPDAYRLTPANYPFSLTVPTRYGDLDTNAHLNNVAIARFFEEGRVRFTRDHGARRIYRGARGLVVSVKIDYLAEGSYPAPVEVAGGYGAVGRTSWRVLQAAFQDGRCIAVCESVLVRIDDAGPAAMPDEWRRVLEAGQVGGA